MIPGLYASAPEPLGFGPSLEIRAFLLCRERGESARLQIRGARTGRRGVNGLGGVSRQYLNHHHEASPACDWVSETFGAPLYVHEEDAGRHQRSATWTRPSPSVTSSVTTSR